jgi:8-oxo-dGTP pyrophosphatase MutT (NUDIX family)
MRPTGMESDSFKFHIRALTKLNYITKKDNGDYQLTTLGKEFANNIDELNRTVQKQPKLSVMLVVSRHNDNNQQEFLFQKRLRSPYYNYWSFITGPVQWGEAFEETAARELEKQTNLTASLEVTTFYRKRDYISAKSNLQEDKLFVILKATNVLGQITNDWSGGANEWMTAEELGQKSLHFDSDFEVIEVIGHGRTYLSQELLYDASNY